MSTSTQSDVSEMTAAADEKGSCVDHTFAVPAYGESPYLESCLDSLRGQSIPSRILITTSTPSSFLRKIAERHGVPLLVNPERSGIGPDWTFAYNAAKTNFVTLAHQDDLYDPRYTELCLEAAIRHPDALIVFTDSAEQVENHVSLRSRNLAVKRCIARAFFGGGGRALRSAWLKKRFISLGNPIMCPSVLYHRTLIGPFEFSRNLVYNLDWHAWLCLSGRKGSFVYLGRPLMKHRIHGNATLVTGTVGEERGIEDRIMFSLFWPKPLARVLAKTYQLAYRGSIGK